jgi:mannose-1-phosphate guanylyltransferase
MININHSFDTTHLFFIDEQVEKMKSSMILTSPSPLTTTHSPIRCGIVLAGGDGKRLQTFIDRLRGDGLPKQYMNFIGSRSMLEHTFQRAEKLISAEHLFTVVNRDHLRFPDVRRQLASRPAGNVVVQPENKETGPGLLLPLIHLIKRYPDSTVVVFPSDHFIAEADLFMVHVELAFRAVEREPSGLVLLGMEPSGAEPEYGYILPGQLVESLLASGVREVSKFIEKPKPPSVRALILKGALWNTMVMVFKAEMLLDLVRRTAPTLFGFFDRIAEAVAAGAETDAVEEAYRQLEPVNFSQGLLVPLSLQLPSPLLVLPVRGVHWSDWGSERRIMSALEKTGQLGRLN